MNLNSIRTKYITINKTENITALELVAPSTINNKKVPKYLIHLLLLSKVNGRAILNNVAKLLGFQ